jgi:hypothetical protein
MAWLFGRVSRQEFTTTIPRLVLYILHFVIHEKAIYSWENIISGELSFRLSNFRKNNKFYMSSYIIFAITYCHVFKGCVYPNKSIIKLTLFRCGTPPYGNRRSCIIFMKFIMHFISVFKKLILGPKTSRLSLEVATFLDKRGSFEAMEHFNIIRIYCSREKPSYLLYYVLDKNIYCRSV